MFGGLYIEQCLLVTHGQFIKGDDLREILETCSLSAVEVGVWLTLIKSKLHFVLCIEN